MSLMPIGPAMWRNNRRVLAERSGWPPVVVVACEHLDALYPDWWINWRAESTTPGFLHPAAFVATRRHGSVAVCARTVEELRERMAAAPEVEDRWWRRNRCCGSR